MSKTQDSKIWTMSQLGRIIRWPLSLLRGVRHLSTHKELPYIEFDSKWEAFFARDNIDGWELRKGINELQGIDIVPEPSIVKAILRACRKCSDHSLAVRYLEALQWKCDAYGKHIYPWMFQEIETTIKELGISTPSELQYDKPELALEEFS
ncbi:hypothetical protein ACOME3_009790 [Neoechinorhynchus agilis]